MKKILLLGLLPFLIVGCASTDEGLKIVSEPPPQPELKVVRREPGSLWSEDSRWNDIYNVAPSRVLGDTLKIKVGEALRARFAQTLNKHKGVGASMEAIPAEKKLETDEPKGPKERAKAEAERAKENAEPEFLDAAITEVLPRGVFAITARQQLSFGSTREQLELVGNIREKDINPDDTISSDAILNLSVSKRGGSR